MQNNSLLIVTSPEKKNQNKNLFKEKKESIQKENLNKRSSF